MSDPAQLKEGARNLLVNCAGLQAGESLLIIHESDDEDWYDAGVTEAVTEVARDLGTNPTLLEVGAPKNEEDSEVTAAIQQHACTIFLTRLGDQDRFSDTVPGRRSVMVYARTSDQLASSYGNTNHKAFEDFKEAVHDVMLGADEIVITCPLGTHLTGDVSHTTREDTRDVSVKRFPLGVPQPIEAATFSGEVAISRFLTTTGSKVYDPDNAVLDGMAMAQVANGRITDFTGDPKTVAQIKQHYDFVSELFGIDPGYVHSWHAGMHPGCSYLPPAAEHPDRWSNSVFTHPQFVHFHTCGAYPPGEICWMVKDQTITFDSVALWEEGRMTPENFGPTADCLDKWPEMKPLFDAPAVEIGS